MDNQLGPKLRVKYKLATIPTSSEIDLWASLVEGLIESGEHPEKAGSVAAREIFKVDDSLLLKSHADTAKALLAMARAK